MRRTVRLLCAAVLLLLAPAAVAAEEKAERESVCRVPDVELSYDTETITTLVTLPVSGCNSREHIQFILSAQISRLDHDGGRDVIERSAMCGPFRSADDFEDGKAPQYSCTMPLWLDHPDVETAQYDVEVTYPGAAAERTMRLFTFCTSNGTDASCEH